MRWLLSGVRVVTLSISVCAAWAQVVIDDPFHSLEQCYDDLTEADADSNNSLSNIEYVQFLSLRVPQMFGLGDDDIDLIESATDFDSLPLPFRALFNFLSQQACSNEEGTICTELEIEENLESEESRRTTFAICTLVDTIALQYLESLTFSPSMPPSNAPSTTPSQRPTAVPSTVPSQYPTSVPSITPSTLPSLSPTIRPSYIPSFIPSFGPSTPSTSPSALPSVTIESSTSPTTLPSESFRPTEIPSIVPSLTSSFLPSDVPFHEDDVGFANAMDDDKSGLSSDIGSYLYSYSFSYDYKMQVKQHKASQAKKKMRTLYFSSVPSYEDISWAFDFVTLSSSNKKTKKMQKGRNNKTKRRLRRLL